MELGGEAAAAKGDRQVAEALTQAIQQGNSNSSEEEVAAALATQEMADAASGVMAEASRLASDIISAGKHSPHAPRSRTLHHGRWLRHPSAQSFCPAQGHACCNVCGKSNYLKGGANEESGSGAAARHVKVYSPEAPQHTFLLRRERCQQSISTEWQELRVRSAWA